MSNAIQIDPLTNKQPLIPLESEYDIRKASNPIACILHIVFKLVGIMSYLFLNLIIKNTFFLILVVIACSALDFYAVQNFTGKSLVGLRWWSAYQDGGIRISKVEAVAVENNPVDQKIFWTFQFGSTVGWVLFSLFSVLKFSPTYIFVSMISLGLSGLNSWGFYKCSQEQQSKLRDMQLMIAQKGLVYAIKK